jgi:hypothetical protein
MRRIYSCSFFGRKPNTLLEYCPTIFWLYLSGGCEAGKAEDELTANRRTVLWYPTALASWERDDRPHLQRRLGAPFKPCFWA